MVSVTVLSDKGSYRRNNQDSCCVLTASTLVGDIGMAVVCDGVGGLSQGEVASSYVVQEFATWFRQMLPELVDTMGATFDAQEVLSSWDALLGRSHEVLRARGRGRGQALGTTFTGVIACKNELLFGQVGDSRLYRLRDSCAEQLTKDQTFVATLLEQGEITEAEAERHPFANVILQAVGADVDLCPVFSVEPLEGDDLLVLCSDGACRKVGAKGICRAFAHIDIHNESALHQACQRLISACAAAGERDNRTVVCLCPEGAYRHDLGTVVIEGGNA